MTTGISWFDAHLDLAYLAETGRDMHAPLAECRGRHAPPSVTLPSLEDARVTRALATVFTEPLPEQPSPANTPAHEPGPWSYPPGDALAAWRVGMRQLKLYHAWRDAGAVAFMPRRGEPADTNPDAPISLGILIEGADPIESPDDLDAWADAGVIAIGLTWARPSRYAAGNDVKPKEDTGLTDLGRALIDRMDERNIVHDLSHLSPRATDDLLAHTSAPVIASHSNARARMPGQPARAGHRHLADDTIREIARRNGVIGINLYSPFLRPDIAHGSKDRASIDDAVAHIEHVCELVGDRRHVGLGSDADGGFGADRLPEGIDTPSDYTRLAAALSARGWPDDDVNAFAFNNWSRFWSGDQA